MARSDSEKHRSLSPLVDAVLDRIVSLDRGDGRFSEYLRMKSGSERQKALKDSRKASGQRLSNVWLPAVSLDQLREKFPGPRGGINWLAVVEAALKK